MLGHGLEHLQAVLFRLTPSSKEGGEGGACFLLRRPAALLGTMFHLGCPQQQRGGAIGRGASWRRQMLPAAAYKKQKQVSDDPKEKTTRRSSRSKFVWGAVGVSQIERVSELFYARAT